MKIEIHIDETELSFEEQEIIKSNPEDLEHYLAVAVHDYLQDISFSDQWNEILAENPDLDLPTDEDTLH